jgi:hypothetical protein
MIKRPYSLWPLAALLLWTGLSAPLQAQNAREDYDDANPWAGFDTPGPRPDSAALAGFLSALAASQPAVCRLAVRSLGNNWHGRASDREAGLLEAELTDEGAHQRLSRTVTDSRALTFLAEALGHQHQCVRRAVSHMLGQSQTLEARRLLRVALEDSDPRVREARRPGSRVRRGCGRVP